MARDARQIDWQNHWRKAAARVGFTAWLEMNQLREASRYSIIESTANTLHGGISESTAQTPRRFVKRLADAGKPSECVDKTRSLTCRCTVAADASFISLRHVLAAAR